VSHFDAAYSAILFRQRRYVIRRESRYAVKLLCATEVSLMETPELRCEDVFGDLPTFRTERLILRKAREEDIAGLFESASDPDVASVYQLGTARFSRSKPCRRRPLVAAIP
jgi:hypothetical protein